MSQAALHQFLTGAADGDAITGHARIIRDWLRGMGFKSELFAQHTDPSMEHEVRHLSRYRRQADEEWAIYHHSVGSSVPDFLAERPIGMKPGQADLSGIEHLHVQRVGEASR